MRPSDWFGVLLASVSTSQAQQKALDLTNFVLPDTGSIDGGNTFPGVTLPLGIVKLGPDLYSGVDAYSGYLPTGNFTGFSMLHESGTGGAPKYGVVSQMPIVGDIVNPLEDHNDTRASPDVTRVGYYKASLGGGTVVEMGATKRAGLYDYTFPDGNMTNTVIVDVSHVLSSYRGQGLGQSYLDGSMSVFPSRGGGSIRYEGHGSYDNGWNRAPRWIVYFCGYFDEHATWKTFVGTDRLGKTLESYNMTSSVDSDTRLGAVFAFSSTKITSRVGVSFISSKQACRNVDDEIPEGTTLSELEESAKKAWNDDVLSKITTTHTDTTNLQLLYTSLYHMTIIPTNKTGENPLWESSEPYYDDMFTFWDLFRCTTALFHILLPGAYEEFLRSLVDIWRHDDFLPDGRSSFFNGATQGGSNADNILADAYVKGVRGAIDWEDAYKAMVTDAETIPPNNLDPRDTSGSTKEGRGALPDWLKFNYITPNFARSVSRSVEYAGNDFGLYQVASGLKKTKEAEKYLQRSRNWRNQWNPNMEWEGFTGFLGPRDASGNFLTQDPLWCGGCYWGDYYYQGLPIEYSFNAHHDMEHLIEASGGDEKFVQRLEMLFVPGLNLRGEARFNWTLFNPGNEPSFTSPYLFNYAGRQDLTVKHSRFIAKSYYHPTPGGLPGNSDAGAMESWVLWVMLGMYPMTGQNVFLIGSPWFSDLTIHLGSNKKLRITTKGGSEEAYYVQSLKVNGKAWHKAWVSWEDVFAQGGTMDFVLDSDPVDWATGERPPSPASGGKALLVKKRAEEIESSGKATVAFLVVMPILGAFLLGSAGRWVWKRQKKEDGSSGARKTWSSIMTWKVKKHVTKVVEKDIPDAESGCGVK